MPKWEWADILSNVKYFPSLLNRYCKKNNITKNKSFKKTKQYYIEIIVTMIIQDSRK